MRLPRDFGAGLEQGAAGGCIRVILGQFPQGGEVGTVRHPAQGHGGGVAGVVFPVAAGEGEDLRGAILRLGL